MSKFSRVAEFAAALWVASATSLSAFLACASGALALPPLEALFAFGNFGLVIGGACWHMLRACRGR